MCNNCILQRWFDVWIKDLLMAANSRGVVPECIMSSGVMVYSNVLHSGGKGSGGEIKQEVGFRLIF